MRPADRGRLHLTGLRLVVVALSLVGLITTSAVLELVRFGEVASRLNQRIAAVAAAPVETLTAAGKITLANDIALWGEASASLSRVLTLSLGSIVVLLFMIVLRVLAHLQARDRTEAQLRQAMAEAERANAAKSDFLATMSHEIRTPLTAIRGYAELLAETALTPEQQNRLSRLTEANGTLAMLIDDILDLSKIEAGRIDLHPAPLDLPALIARVVALVAPTAKAKGLDLRADLAQDLPRHVLADGMRLLQVLLNLANNAVKFTPSGAVTIGASVQEGGLRLAVTDTGIGIAEGDLPKLFKRFSQIDSSISRAHAGSGLGLAISRGLVERMGGEIAVESRPGTGTTFTITLPLHLAEGVEDLAKDAPALPRRAAHILVVDDSEQTRELVTSVLRRDGHRCVTARDGEEGVAAAASERFDLVIMDMQMPRMDGVAAIAAIRALPAPLGTVPILALTANALTGQAAPMLAAGADRYLAKPFAIDALSDAVASLSGMPPGETAVQDRDELLALAGLMGRDWVLARIDAVLSGLGWTDAPLAASDLRRHAHRLVAEAGQLGLTALGKAAAELQQAIDAGTDPAQPLAALQKVARHSRAMAADLRALISEPCGATSRM